MITGLMCLSIGYLLGRWVERRPHNSWWHRPIYQRSDGTLRFTDKTRAH